MSPAEILIALGRLGVTLEPHGDRLRCRAPRGALTPHWLDILQTYKPELLGYLQQPPSPSDRRQGCPSAGSRHRRHQGAE
jgi:TubC N-terminal docking domain